MPFKKTVSGNPKGKKSRPVKPMIEKLLEKSFPAIEQEMASNPEARAGFYLSSTSVSLVINNNKF